jgi:hypothetical protein
MEESDPLVLFIGLPTIPLTLILAKMIRWQDYVLRAWRRLTPGMSVFKYLFPEESTEHQVPLREPTEETVVDATSATRIICGALSLPSIAMFCGNILFQHSPSRTKRIFLVRPGFGNFVHGYIISSRDIFLIMRNLEAISLFQQFFSCDAISQSEQCLNSSKISRFISQMFSKSNTPKRQKRIGNEKYLKNTMQ